MVYLERQSQVWQESLWGRWTQEAGRVKEGRILQPGGGPEESPSVDGTCTESHGPSVVVPALKPFSLSSIKWLEFDFFPFDINLENDCSNTWPPYVHKRETTYRGLGPVKIMFKIWNDDSREHFTFLEKNRRVEKVLGWTTESRSYGHISIYWHTNLFIHLFLHLLWPQPVCPSD